MNSPFSGILSSMFKGKKGPYILIGILLLTLFFILGIQYGKQVERADKTITYLLSITPTKKIEPTVVHDITFQTYIHEGCGVSFLYPSIIQVTKESTDSAELSSTKNTQTLTISCNKNPIPTPEAQSATIALDTQTGIVFTIEDKREYRVRNPINNKLIMMNMDKGLSPLIVNSFQFTK